MPLSAALVNGLAPFCSHLYTGYSAALARSSIRDFELTALSQQKFGPMTDKLTPERRSENMARIRSTDTKPEMAVRRFVHALGYRFRLHRADLPGKPDLVFPSRQKVIFVHGCFWHQHADRRCKIARRPKSSGDYWNAKLDRNVARDARVKRALKKFGWKTMTIWECQVRAGPKAFERSVRRFLDG